MVPPPGSVRVMANSLARSAVSTTAIAGSPAGWAAVRAASRETLRFASEQPALAQLLFNRVVPGFVPSERAYAPSVRGVELIRAAMTAAVERGELHPAAATERGLALLLALIAGFGSQHHANEPDTAFAESPLIALLDPALDMYAAYFSPARPAGWTPWTGPGR